MLVHAITTNAAYEFATEVHAGLTRPGQKELPSKYLYDDVGSALFEVISYLPEYGLTRADERLLRRNADDIVDRLHWSRCSGRTGKWKREEDSLVARSALPPATNFVLSRRNFAVRVGHVRARTPRH